jgi:hypothetical protein
MSARALLKPVLKPCYDSVMPFKTRVCVTYSLYQEAIPVRSETGDYLHVYVRAEGLHSVRQIWGRILSPVELIYSKETSQNKYLPISPVKISVLQLSCQQSRNSRVRIKAFL